MDETETISQNLRGELARRRITQAELGDELGVSQAVVSARLSGRYAFDTDQLSKIASMFDMTLYQLMLKLLQPIDNIKQIKP
jgi:predicted transcriptional regulator